MTDTRDELATEVIDIYAEPENFPREDASEHAEKILRLIDEAVAARDAEIREALVSDDWLDNMYCALEDGMYWDDSVHPIPDGDEWAYEKLPFHVLVEEMEKRLDDIGLAEKGAER